MIQHINKEAGGYLLIIKENFAMHCMLYAHTHTWKKYE